MPNALEFEEDEVTRHTPNSGSAFLLKWIFDRWGDEATKAVLWQVGLMCKTSNLGMQRDIVFPDVAENSSIAGR